MTERERLIELIETGTRIAYDRSLEDVKRIVKENHHFNSATDRTVSVSEMVADYLLENNVFVAPVTEGDSVYIILLGHILPFDVISVSLFRKTLIFKAQHGLNLTWVFKMEDFGKTVFLTREEAEKALKESEQK